MQNINDIKYEIYMNLDIHDLSAVCMTDKSSIQVCSSKLFWVQYFQKHHLPVPNNIDYYADWIEEFYIAKEVDDLIKQLEKEGINAINSYEKGYSTWVEGKTYVLDDADYTELLITDPIDGYLIKIIDHANQYDFDPKNTTINIKYDNIWENNFVSQNSNFTYQWVLTYILYDENGEEIVGKKINIDKDQARRYLNNIIFLNLEEN